MTKIPAIVAIALLVASPLVAESETHEPVIEVFLSAGYVFPVGAVAYAGIEYTFGSLIVGNSTTLSYRTGGVVQFAVADMALPWSYTTIGAAFLGTASISFGEKLTFSVAPGFGINYYFYSGDPSYYTNRETFYLKLVALASMRYRLSNTVATGVNFEYWGEYIGPNIGLGFYFALL